ncbi:MAG: hypothetical protein KF847_05135 [Pirellulales bacterium]|nr:hypothetical protein [Pirellulales bacterium]
MGQTILGGVIGAAVGLAANIGLEIATTKEMIWFPVIIGLLTGLGVRQLNKSSAMHHASYLRGAIAAAIALAAIAGAPKVKSMVIARKGAAEVAKATAAPKAGEETTEEGEAAEGEAADAPAIPEGPRPGAIGQIGLGKAPGGPGEPDIWQAVFMAVGAFLAYEFARGAGAPAPVAAPSDQAAPEGKPTDPSE